MSTPYNCELCKKEFKQKIDFTRHTSKKVPCISLSEIKQLEQNKGVTKDNKAILVNTFKQILNILRDSGEGITGDKALRNMCYLLILKMIEPQLDTQINIDNYPYDFSDISDDFVEIHKIKMLQIVRFTNLANEPQENLSTNIKYLWDSVLSQHPSTKNIFLKGKNFDIKRDITYKKVIDHLNKITFTDSGFDVLGEAYEEVIKGVMVGKVFGQFFTPLPVKELMVKLINPQIHPDGKIDTIGDPTMGTGGFLISYLKHIKEQANIKQIQPDWDFIKTHGLYGKEVESDTYQLAISNMLISTGHMFENMDNGDSIREPITRKFDNILANPPFGIEGLKYDEFDFINTNILKTEYIPIKSNNAVSLFIQAIIYMLNINGKCAIVLPDGQDLTSKTTKTLVYIREYLMKTCNLKKIVYLPSGTFTHVKIKTCIFYFIKKREGKYVLETNIKVSKTTQKEIDRTYKFHKTHQTTKIKFYEFNESKKETYLLVEVPIETIANNSYSLNYAEYMKNETESEELEEGIVMKTLGAVCEFLPKSKRQASYGEKQGQYPFYTSSQTCSKYCDEYDYEDECLIIGTGGNANIKYSSKFSCSTDNFVIKINQGQLVKYIYYYLLINIEILQKGFVGVGLQHISKEYSSNIKIPIPSLEKQQEIVNYLDFIYEKCVKTSLSKIAELKQLNEFCLKNQQLYGHNVVKELGEITTYKSGKRLPQGHILQNNKTPYPYIRIKDIDNNSISLDNIKYISQETKDIINKYIITTNDIYITIAGTTGLTGIIPNELTGANLTENAVRINIVNKNEILQKYLVYDIHYNQQEELKTKTIGAAIPKLSIERLMTLKIPVPSLDKQQEIVEYCEYNDALIKQLELEIENNKKQAHKFMSSIVKPSKIEPDINDLVDSLDTLSL